MVKNYLSKTDRANILFVNGLIAKVDDTVEQMSNSKDCDKDVLKYLRMSRSFAEKAMNKMIDPIRQDKKKLGTLMNECNYHEVMLMPQTTARTKMLEIVEEEVKVRAEVNRMLGHDPLYFLSEQVMLFKCSGCDGTPHENGGCPIAQTFVEMDIPPWNPDEPICHYAFAGLTGEKLKEAKNK